MTRVIEGTINRQEVMTRLIDIKSQADLDRALAASDVAVVHFWASWCEPCAQLDNVLGLLATDHIGGFLRVEAEEVTDVSLEHDIKVVPLFLIFKKGKVIHRLEGADVAALTSKVNQHFPSKQLSTDGTAGSVAGPTAPPQTRGASAPPVTDGNVERAKALINSQPVMLLMKGSPDAPRCGFSSRTAAILKKLGVPFGSFDILSDEAVRQAAKVYSDWPSYPQLYVRGDLIGGCDIVEEMDASGELRQILQPGTSGANGDAGGVIPLQERLKRLVNSADVVLFMKGSPEAPRCGFSAKVVQALNSAQVPFDSFDILEDQEVREGLKKFSDWPTYPQLYAGGELLGGCDIILELQKQQQLKSEIEDHLPASHH